MNAWNSPKSGPQNGEAVVSVDNPLVWSTCLSPLLNWDLSHLHSGRQGEWREYTISAILSFYYPGTNTPKTLHSTLCSFFTAKMCTYITKRMLCSTTSMVNSLLLLAVHRVRLRCSKIFRLLNSVKITGRQESKYLWGAEPYSFISSGRCHAQSAGCKS